MVRRLTTTAWITQSVTRHSTHQEWREDDILYTGTTTPVRWSKLARVLPLLVLAVWSTLTCVGMSHADEDFFDRRQDELRAYDQQRQQEWQDTENYVNRGFAQAQEHNRQFQDWQRGEQKWLNGPEGPSGSYGGFCCDSWGVRRCQLLNTGSSIGEACLSGLTL